MKKSVKKKTFKQELKRFEQNIESDYFCQDIDPARQSSLASQTQSDMLVSISQTERFKLQFLVSSYQDLIQNFKQNRKEFLQIMRTQLQRHTFYYSEILDYIKKTEDSTRKVLRQKIEDLSNIFKLKISFFQTKLKHVLRILFDQSQKNSPRKNKFKDNQGSGLKKGKVSSYEEGLDFQQQLKELYVQKDFQLPFNFIQNHEIHESLQTVKRLLIKDWESKNQSKSVSFSSVSRLQSFEETFLSHEIPFEERNHMIDNGNEEIDRYSQKIVYYSKGTETSTLPKQKFSLSHESNYRSVNERQR